MFRVVMEDLPGDAVAAIYQEGDDVLILCSRNHTDDERCEALNLLYAQISPPAPRCSHPQPEPQRLVLVS